MHEQETWKDDALDASEESDMFSSMHLNSPSRVMEWFIFWHRAQAVFLSEF